MGSRAMLSMAATVSVGAEGAERVEAVRRFPQEVLSPSVPPGELTQTERMLARVLICWTGAVAPLGSDGPETAPVAGSTRELARVKASESQAASREVEPMAEAEVIKGARAVTAATVVRSLITTLVDEVREP